ncbi:MAG: hypothetical protein GC131_08220 [Alphaproteobacteria bacterium]|nr:hypothetical protein [Alphaproteobacteria bacterium]
MMPRTQQQKTGIKAMHGAATAHIVQTEPERADMNVQVQTACIDLTLLGFVYEDSDFLKRPVGHLFAVCDESGRERELFVPLHVVAAATRKVYICDAGGACYIEPGRRGFTRSQMMLTITPPSEAVRRQVRSFFNSQNTPENNRKFLIIITG